MHFRRLIAIAAVVMVCADASSLSGYAQIGGAMTFQLRTFEDALFDASQARGDFADGMEELAAGYHQDKTRKRAAAKLEESIDAVLRYLRFVSPDRPLAVHSFSSLQDREQLVMETLETAKRLQPEMTKLIRAEYSAMLKADHGNFRYNLEIDLLRLKQIAHQLRH